MSSQEAFMNHKNDKESYPMKDINQKSDEKTPLTKSQPDDEGEEDTKNHNELDDQSAAINEKLSLEKDLEATAGQNQNNGAGQKNAGRKSLTAAYQAAEELFRNRNIRIIFVVVCLILLFLSVLVVAIFLMLGFNNDDETYRFIHIVPRPRGPMNLIYYRHGDLRASKDVRTWVDMVHEIDLFLAPYRRPTNTTLCLVNDRQRIPETEVCLFDIGTIAKDCLKPDYGYMAGRPCIFIVFNNITDWLPDSSSSSSSSVVNGSSNAATNIVGLECNTNTQFDAENIGPMEFTPYQGFSSIYFPYKGQENYMPPFVAIRLPAPSHNVGIGLTCRLLAPTLQASSSNDDDEMASSSSDQPVPYIPFNIFIE